MQTANRTRNGLMLLAALATLGMAGNPAQAGTVITDATIVSSKPIIETAYEPYEECSSTYRKVDPYAKRNDNVSQVVGGLVGGAAGSFAGKGTGKDAAAALGAVIGSEVLSENNDGITEGEIIGAVVGGIVGNQVGKGGGKTAATASGALIGKIVGGNLQEGNSASGPAPAGYERVRACRTLEREKKVITGYEVEYIYAGEIYSDILPYEPGETVRIAVDVGIVEESSYNR